MRPIRREGIRKKDVERTEVTGSLKKRKTCKFSKDGEHDFQWTTDGYSYFLAPNTTAFEFYLEKTCKALEEKQEGKAGLRMWGGVGKVFVAYKCTKCGKSSYQVQAAENFPFNYVYKKKKI